MRCKSSLRDKRCIGKLELKDQSNQYLVCILSQQSTYCTHCTIFVYKELCQTKIDILLFFRARKKDMLAKHKFNTFTCYYSTKSNWMNFAGTSILWDFRSHVPWLSKRPRKLHLPVFTLSSIVPAIEEMALRSLPELCANVTSM